MLSRLCGRQRPANVKQIISARFRGLATAARGEADNLRNIALVAHIGKFA